MAYYEQPGRTITIDKDGKQIVTITYVGNVEAPSAPVRGTLKSKTITKDVAGTIRTQFQYETDATSSNVIAFKPVQIEIISAVRTVPIETHPQFGGSQIGYGGYIAPEDIKLIKETISTPNKVFDDIKDNLISKEDRCLKLYNFMASGIESYYLPSLVVRKTYQAASPPSAGKVGKINNPGVTIAGIPSGADFLLINISSRGQKGAYTVTEEYEMSGEGGWNKFLYS
jgi:hypothetical protein